MKWILLTNAAATLMMTGLIWFVQIVHYPLFGQVGKSGFALYEASHSSLTTLVVMPLMLIELLTAFLLVAQKPVDASAFWLVAGLLLIGVIWLATFFLSVPQHNILSRGFDEQAHRTLVLTNWIRTVAWSARSLILLFLLARTIK
ncbi:MAG TPA: hypothetical protein VGB07_15725 [Blastocatellia bacterium]